LSTAHCVGAEVGAGVTIDSPMAMSAMHNTVADCIVGELHQWREGLPGRWERANESNGGGSRQSVKLFSAA